MRYLDIRAVRDIHDQLVDDFVNSDDPIDPPGVRGDGAFLESALTRPRTSIYGRAKYPTVEMAAAALLHALVHNHPFHNGNKRTAIVALLVFLDMNGYLLTAEEAELFSYVLALSGHGATKEGEFISHIPSADDETFEASKWIASHVRKLNKEHRILKWKDFEAILRGYGCTFEHRTGNRIAITRGSLRAFSGARNDGDEMTPDRIMYVRRRLELDEEHGIDSDSFYYNGSVVPDFINRYRQLLRRLARY
jgi:death-on-curing family protein